MAIVDRYDQPGGHRTVAHPFIHPHQPSAFYGVNSRELGSGTADRDGWNAGRHELASAGEILTCFDQVMRRTLLPTGRVSYFPKSFYDGPDPRRPDVQLFHSVVSGAAFEVTVKRRTVDATSMNATVPAMTPPPTGLPRTRVTGGETAPRKAPAPDGRLGCRRPGRCEVIALKETAGGPRTGSAGCRRAEHRQPGGAAGSTGRSRRHCGGRWRVAVCPVPKTYPQRLELLTPTSGPGADQHSADSGHHHRFGRSTPV
ncbi:hypothetical protein GCM10010211_11740 [Streptomyces albospinus]|uniref:Uncharacterized protein n=1 Tax=Streptomyces albospinus TaxID=285515 RepID=A0ABQ2UQS1_9ACTN|nr:hypothetical protein [Streptomyces albospinus]GGU49269.1 hypothetical protein GCM10010211_11740 [Streptomyces albospinus]